MVDVDIEQQQQQQGEAEAWQTAQTMSAFLSAPGGGDKG